MRELLLVIFLVVLAGVSCSKGGTTVVIPPPPANYLDIRVHFSIEECPEGSAACTIYFKDKATGLPVKGRRIDMYLPERGWRDCLMHEFDHAVYGEWHGKKSATCSETAY